MNDQLTDLFEQQYKTFVKRVSRRVPNPTDAEDIVMSAFERAVKYWDTFDPERSDLGVWFNTLVNNESRDWHRKNRMQGMTTTVDEKNGGMYECDGPERQLSTAMVQEVSRMKAGFKKDVVYRRFYMGLSVPQIAGVMECGRERVKKCLIRWRAEMKGKYGVTV